MPTEEEASAWKDWVVYAKRPFGGPEYVLRYLGRYTHRVAISNHRLVSFADQKVTFRWRDSAHNNEQRLLTLSLDEFLRRFLLHLLPDSGKWVFRRKKTASAKTTYVAITLPDSQQPRFARRVVFCVLLISIRASAGTAASSRHWSCRNKKALYDPVQPEITDGSCFLTG
jgi:hypothetical protein